MLLVEPSTVWEKNLTSAQLLLRPRPHPWDSHLVGVSMSGSGRVHAVTHSASRLRARRGLLVLGALKVTSPQGEAVSGQPRARAGVHTSPGRDSPQTTHHGGGGRASAHLDMQGHSVQGHRMLRVSRRLLLPQQSRTQPAAPGQAEAATPQGGSQRV